MKRETQTSLKKHIDFLDSISKHIKWKLIVSNPMVPRLYGLPKIHKPGFNMRPIVSNNNAPMENIAKFLVSTFNNLIPPIGLYVNNTYEFVDKLISQNINNTEIMVSFDVVSLFPSIPIPETLVILKKWLQHQHLSSKEVDTYMDLTTMCMNLNYFQFDYQFYKQDSGSAMGQSLSPFIANLFMADLESRLNNSTMFPRFWVRYVDDIFAIIKKDNLIPFLNLLNLQHQSIKFTMEEDKENKLPFLDILVHREEIRFTLKIYRKPSTTMRFIPENSFCNNRHKTASFNSMIYRACNIPMEPKHFDEEINYIKDIAIFNGFNVKLVDSIKSKQLARKKLKSCTTLLPIDEKEPVRRHKIIYYPKITNQISKIFKSHNIELVNYSNSKLGQCLGSTKDKIIDNNLKPGIYEISCKDCNGIYVGQSKRPVKARFKEHLLHVKNIEPKKSSVAAHILETDHRIEFDNLKLIKQVTDQRKLDAWESLLIQQNRSNKTLLNSDNGPINSQLLKLKVKP